VVTPSSEMPEATVPSQTAPQEQKATPPTLKMRVSHWIITLIAIASGIGAYWLFRRVLPPKVLEPLERNITEIIEYIVKHLLH
jgi:hypothetical protein